MDMAYNRGRKVLANSNASVGYDTEGHIKSSGENEMKRKGIMKLLWISLGLDFLFYILVMFTIILQNQFKHFFNISQIEFIWPVVPIAHFTILLMLHIILTAILIRQLKEGAKNYV